MNDTPEPKSRYSSSKLDRLYYLVRHVIQVNYTVRFGAQVEATSVWEQAFLLWLVPELAHKIKISTLCLLPNSTQ